jgi:hypothetical protein
MKRSRKELALVAAVVLATAVHLAALVAGALS